ncbi:MAG: GNAT family N-acetyltransferase [Deltaproteobacteria bacterium]|nr:GNAT family N-acetyltransferase [Deltaproteobacteria bacterium]
MEVTLRPIEPGELAALHRLWEEAGLPHEPEGRDTLAELERQRARDADLWLGAYLADRLVGSVVGTDDGRKGWINRLAVHPELRRTGLARRLVEACEAAFRARGRIIVTALVEHQNEASLAFFEEAGYQLRRDVLYLRKAWGPAGTC